MIQALWHNWHHHQHLHWKNVMLCHLATCFVAQHMVNSSKRWDANIFRSDVVICSDVIYLDNVAIQILSIFSRIFAKTFWIYFMVIFDCATTACVLQLRHKQTLLWNSDLVSVYWINSETIFCNFIMLWWRHFTKVKLLDNGCWNRTFEGFQNTP